MRSLPDEVERCMPFFVRLCINRVIASGIRLDEAAIQMARDLYIKFPPTMDRELRLHFEATLSDLVDLVTSLAPRLPPQTLISFAAKASQVQIATTLERSLLAQRPRNS